MAEATSGKRFHLIGRDGAKYESDLRGTLGGNSRLRIYGRLTCGTAIAALSKGYARVRVFFADEETAIAVGYRPCGNCLKKQYKVWARGGIPGSVDFPWLITKDKQ